MATIPQLGYALLGLLQGKPSSGYDLRKIFSSTSMRTYSDSPGSIYPALLRLEKQGLIRGSIETGSRRRQVFRLTPKGLNELRKWITAPVTRDDVVRFPDSVLLRFAFSEIVVGPAASLELLRSLANALKAQVATLREEYEAFPKAVPTSGRLAFECGLQGTKTLLKWAQSAITTYETQLGRKRGGTP